MITHARNTCGLMFSTSRKRSQTQRIVMEDMSQEDDVSANTAAFRVVTRSEVSREQVDSNVSGRWSELFWTCR